MIIYDIELEDTVPFSEKFVWDLQAVRNLGRWLYESTTVESLEEYPFLLDMRSLYLKMPLDTEILDAIDSIHERRTTATKDEE